MLKECGDMQWTIILTSVATTWSLSFERVRREMPCAADLLRLCAFLAPDAIPEEIITEGASASWTNICRQCARDADGIA